MPLIQQEPNTKKFQMMKLSKLKTLINLRLNNGIMKQTSQTLSQTLYEVDYYRWIETTLEQLENENFEAVDWDNLLDEVADLARRQKRKVESLSTLILEHLLKLKYWESEKANNQNHWKAEIRTFRKQLKKELRASPSLNVYLQDIWAECYQDAKEIFGERAQITPDKLPVIPCLTVEQLLDDNWFP